jgi:hypothetical protein
MSVHNYQKNRAIAALLASALPVAAMAQLPLPDPTRPPPGFVDELPPVGTGGAPQVSPEVSARAAKAAADAPASGLQSVLIPRQGKPVAIIDGKYVPLGERYGDWELVAVAESHVVLGKGKERRVLRLTPAAEKRHARAGADTKMQSHPARPEQSRKESETGR